MNAIELRDHLNATPPVMPDGFQFEGWFVDEKANNESVFCYVSHTTPTPRGRPFSWSVVYAAECRTVAPQTVALVRIDEAIEAVRDLMRQPEPVNKEGL